MVFVIDRSEGTCDVSGLSYSSDDNNDKLSDMLLNLKIFKLTNMNTKFNGDNCCRNTSLGLKFRKFI